MERLVVLKFGAGNFELGFPVTLQIGEDGSIPRLEIVRFLPPELEIPHLYKGWVSSYRRLGGMDRRIKIPDRQITNISQQEDWEDCHSKAQLLRDKLNFWLRQPACLDLRETILSEVQQNDSVRVILQTQDLFLQRLPWHLWDLFARYQQAEIALSLPNYKGGEFKPIATPVKILAILGSSEGIDVKTDRSLLEKLPSATIAFLEKPRSQQLQDYLWENSWDILFFAGHSSSETQGEIQINHSESLTIEQLRYALTKAVENGLKLAIFNSCDGLGLAQDLASLNIPQMIVMREPVPDKVAQEFLKYFLVSFANGTPFYQSVRTARERLQGIENQFPCATWLPVICQNPAYLPIKWPSVEKAIATPEIAKKNNSQQLFKQLSQQDYRYRQILLNKVRNYWINGVLENSLHGNILIELGLEERLDAVEHPWGLVWESCNLPRQILPKGTTVSEKFTQLGVGRSLLILGEPGAGKTTTLLELGKDLIERSQLDLTQPIPVVFNLSSWTEERQTIADWLVKELHSKYQVSPEIGRNWLEQQQLLLLLDGLDEVSPKRRPACVLALNKFIQKYGQTEIVVCSRIKDYDALSQRLSLQAAIYLQPLTPAQIQQYIVNAGIEVTAFNRAISEDETLQELVKSPLMLSIITLANQGLSISELTKKSKGELHQHLFNAYIDRMFNRKAATITETKEQVKHWLSRLAKQMESESQTVFLIERMQPNWLRNPQERWMYLIGLLLIYCLGIVSIFTNLYSTKKAIFWLVMGLLWAIFIGINQINPVETLQWSWKKTRKNLILGLIFSLPFGLIFRPLYEILFTTKGQIFHPAIQHSIILGLGWGLSLGLTFGLIRGLTGAGIATVTVPNQGIWNSGKNSLILALIGVLCMGLIAQILHTPLLLWTFLGMCFGLVVGGGEACVKHFVLRLVLYINGDIPWNYAGFLDRCTKLIFLQKVGGGFIFIHRSLLEHFARM